MIVPGNKLKEDEYFLPEAGNKLKEDAIKLKNLGKGTAFVEIFRIKWGLVASSK